MAGNNKRIVIDVTDRLKCLDLGLEVQAFLVVGKKTVSEPIELENGMIAVRVDAAVYLVAETAGELVRLSGLHGLSVAQEYKNG